MNVNLTRELEQLVQSRVNSGRYASASEVVSDALRLLADRDELMALRKEELRKKIARGLDSIERGQGVDGDEFLSQLEQEEAALDKCYLVAPPRTNHSQSQHRHHLKNQVTSRHLN